MKKILVVGSWAKEQITVENIKRSPRYKVFCYLDTNNPGIIDQVDEYKIGSLCKTDEILKYALSVQADLVLITTALPLSRGVTDRLLKENIAVFGPTRQAAMLESDKAFARKLMKKAGLDDIPEFAVFEQEKEAYKFAEKLSWEVAVKPLGLTEGLGVKVAGNQLNSKEQIIEYINEILSNKIGGTSKVLIEEKLTGEEFTIQCLVYGEEIIPTFAVQDFKKLLPADRGVNTASMGSYSDKGKLLPFLKEEEYQFALNLIKKTIEAFKKETATDACGFLYGQFILTERGVKLVEYNFRPGDPEWINILYVLKDNVADKVLSLMEGVKIELDFESKATVCKYIVPESYPEKLNQTLDISFSPQKIKNIGVDFYYSAGRDENNKLNVGEERGLAFIAKDNSISEANERIEKAISLIRGNFRYRDDIGTKEMINYKENYVAKNLRKQ
jgi:phosphoribosylamine---glycine ligase